MGDVLQKKMHYTEQELPLAHLFLASTYSIFPEYIKLAVQFFAQQGTRFLEAI
jgi:hypothetical protein